MYETGAEKLTERRTDVHNEDGQMRICIVTEEIVEKVVRKSRRFTISELSVEFLETSWSVLHDIVSHIRRITDL